MYIICAIGTDNRYARLCDSSRPFSSRMFGDSRFPELCARTEQGSGNRLSPSMLRDSSPELSQKHSQLVSVPIAHKISICYVWIYRARPDFRSPQQTPKTVSRAISQFLAYIYYTRDQDRHYVSISMPRLIDVGRVSGRRWPPS